MKIKKITILTILTLVFFIGCGDKKKIDEDMVSTNTAETKAPEFNLKTPDGKNIDIVVKKDGWQFKGYEGKVVLLSFFGTWCPPCKAEIPHLLNIKDKLKDKLQIIAVDVGKRDGGYNTKEELEEFIKRFNITYPIVTGPENRKLFSTVMELNPGGSIPFMILFNRKGQYVQYYIGMKPEEMLFSDISQAINMK